GELALAGGAADVPMAGLELRQIDLRVHSDAARPGQLAIAGGLTSGEGRVDLSGHVDLASGGTALTIAGDRLLAYDTPDARVLVSPDLQLGWDSDVLTLRGRVAVPEAVITPQLGLSPALLTEDTTTTPQPGRVIAPSPDVVIIDAAGELEEPPASAPPLRLDSRLELLVGDRVNVRALGLIGRLTGKVTFINRPGGDLLPVANGSLAIEDGTFRAFGQDLEIETGRVVFAGKPVTEPELNVRAVRWIDNDPVVSSVGVLLTGPARQPLLELFSRPELDQTEIQSYLLTGSGSGNRDSVLSIGTYLYPKLYVSYGYNLLEETNQFDTLYTITPRYGVEAKVGEADNTLNMTITYEH
ncbi:MAG: translocation/assembly module TamB domain-containing protein, partial [Halieaceae bacterium]|nr:translocation/assembly module TamB domain-containing protein [Halieaceae bacterium]